MLLSKNQIIRREALVIITGELDLAKHVAAPTKVTETTVLIGVKGGCHPGSEGMAALLGTGQARVLITGRAISVIEVGPELSQSNRVIA